VLRLASEQMRTQECDIVVIAGRDQQLGAESLRGVDHRTQADVGLCFALISHVAGEHEHVGNASRRGNHLDRRLNSGARIDAIERETLGGNVRVGDLHDRVAGPAARAVDARGHSRVRISHHVRSSQRCVLHLLPSGERQPDLPRSGHEQ